MELLRIYPISYDSKNARETPAAYEGRILYARGEGQYDFVLANFGNTLYKLQGAKSIKIYFHIDDVSVVENESIDYLNRPFGLVGTYHGDKKEILDISPNTLRFVEIVDTEEINQLITQQDGKVFLEVNCKNIWTSAPYDEYHVIGTVDASISELYIEYEGYNESKAYAMPIAPIDTTTTTGNSLKFEWDLFNLNVEVTQSSYEIQISQNGTDWSTLANVLSSNQEYTAQPQTIAQGDWYWRVRCNTNLGLTEWSESKQFKLTGTPQITNLSLNQNNVDYTMVLSWLKLYQSKYELEIYQSSILKATFNGTTSSTVSIPVGTLTEIGPTTFRVRIANTVDGVDIWTDWASINQTLTRIVPSVSNLTVEDNFWEKAIRVNWRSESQSFWEMEILKSNVVVATFNGGTEKDFTVPIGTLTEGGAYVFRVRPIYQPTWSTTDLSYGSWQERSITLNDIMPTVSNLALSGANIDFDLTFSWASTDQQTYEVEVLKDDLVVDSYSGTTAKQIVFTNNTLSIGLHKFRIRVGYSDRWTDWQEINATLVESVPSIGVLEPDGTIVDRDNQIRIWWTSFNQSEWELNIDDGAYTFSGTYETEQLMAPGLLQTGKHTLQLNVTYITGAGVRKTTTKRAEFIVQGKPPIPTITSGDLFFNNRPTISWDTQDQQGYILEILQGGNVVWTTEWQNGLVTRQKILTYLANGVYTARVKVINQYSIESDWGTKTFEISTNIDTEILLEVTTQDNASYLSWNNENSAFEVFYVLRNGIVIAKTTDTIYNDYTAHFETEYTVRGINEDDVFKDSNTVSAIAEIGQGVIATVDMLDDMQNVGRVEGNYTFNGNIGVEGELIHCTGREKPIMIFGEHTTNTYSINFVIWEDYFKFVEMCKRRKVFCYRDRRQKLFLAVTNPNYTVDSTLLEHSISATEVDYSEVVSYD